MRITDPQCQSMLERDYKSQIKSVRITNPHQQDSIFKQFGKNYSSLQFKRSQIRGNTQIRKSDINPFINQITSTLQFEISNIG
jgi:hypothetical protein